MASLDAGATSAEAKGPYRRLRVADVIEETADARSIVLDVPPEEAERFAYVAGQFLSFRVQVAGHRLVRCYSLASAPGIDPAPKVTIKRVVEGRVSNWMNDHVAKGDLLEVMPPNGEVFATEGLLGCGSQASHRLLTQLGGGRIDGAGSRCLRRRPTRCRRCRH